MQLKTNFNTEVYICEHDSVRLLRNIIKEMNFTKLFSTYSKIGRKPVVSAVTMFTIVIYAYMNRIFSCRDIEKACKRDVNFMWLLGEKPAPDHSTIHRFRDKRLLPVMNDLFYQFINILHKQKEIKYKSLFVDGTKIEAYANRYTFVWKKSIQKYKTSLIEKIYTFLERYKHTCFVDNTGSDEYIIALLKRVEKHITNKMYKENITFVNGKGKRKSLVQKDYEILKEYILKFEGYNSSLEKMLYRNSYSKTDNEATFMRMKEDHMRNGQLKPAYNFQIAVEGGYLLATSLSSERTDVNTLISFIDKIHKNIPEKIHSLVADSGYESEQNYLYLSENNITSYIKPNNYEKRKTRKFKNDISKRENMKYLVDEDCFICANGKKLLFSRTVKRKNVSGYISEKSRYSCSDCEKCDIKERCLKKAKTKNIEFSKTFESLRELSNINIQTLEGKKLRMNRSIQAEGIFAYIKENMKYKRFRHRNKQKIENDISILAFSINLNKLHKKVLNNNLGYLEYPLK